MHSTTKTILSIYFVILLAMPSWAATIVSPKEGEQVAAGSWITVSVKPEPGEQWQGFVIGFKALEYDQMDNVYKITIQVPKDVLGYRDDLRVIGVDKDRNEIELIRKIFVKLPPNVILQSIVAGGSGGGGLVVLEKLPLNSSASDVENFEREQLSVYGRYTDSVNRELTASASGTTYTSSNEKIVTVSPDGKVTAQGLGEAKITVRHEKYSAEVTVVVKSYNK